MREGGAGAGGWTVAFSGPDKSKKERVVINVPKWPRVTGGPSPLTALKRGRLRNHPSHGRTHTGTKLPCHPVYACSCDECAWIEQIFPQQFAIPGHTEAHGVQGNVQRTHRRPSNAADLCRCSCCTGLSFPRVESCTQTLGGWHTGITDHLRTTHDLHFSAAPPSLRPDSQTQMHY